MFILVPGIVYQGNNILNGFYSESHASCQENCSLIDQCVAFTYFQNNCFLKNRFLLPSQSNVASNSSIIVLGIFRLTLYVQLRSYVFICLFLA